MTTSLEGILPIDKPKGRSSFSLIPMLRKKLEVQKIGHTGTLDPIASGVLVFLIGKNYTKMQGGLMKVDKEYIATLCLGSATDTYDIEGRVTHTSMHKPTTEDILHALQSFQGDILQTPPMFSAKKHNGKRLYSLARSGITVTRQPVPVWVKVSLKSYSYPHLHLHIHCSSGTYIRSLANDLGNILGCYAHIEELARTLCGEFSLSDCLSLSEVNIADKTSIKLYSKNLFL